MIEPVLNERSLEPADVPTVERLTALVAVLRRLDALGFSKVVRYARNAKEREIEVGRTFNEWLFRKAPKELMQFVAGRMSRAPYVEDLHEARESASQALFQATFGGEPATGAGVAYLLDAPSVALRGVACWEVDPLAIELSQMDAESEALDTRKVDVVHLSSAEQVSAREAFLRTRLLRALPSGDALWDRRDELFPRLDFCACVEAQVREMTGKEFYFQHVVLALSRLDVAVGTWSSGLLHPGMDSSPESKQTLDHGSYGPMRDFDCPDGATRRFSNHLKLFSNNWRIYYWESHAPATGGRAFVGYVGKHLPTTRYRT